MIVRRNECVAFVGDTARLLLEILRGFCRRYCAAFVGDTARTLMKRLTSFKDLLLLCSYICFQFLGVFYDFSYYFI